MYKQKNLSLYFFMYIIAGILAGVCLDTVPTYLHYNKAMQGVEEAYSAYLGIGALLGALVVSYAKKVGFKPVIICSNLLGVMSYLVILYTENRIFVSIALIAFSISLFAFDIMVAPFVDRFSSDSNKTKWYSKIYYGNMLGLAIGMLFGGTLVVLVVSVMTHVPYSEAKILTENVGTMTAVQMAAYIEGYKWVFRVALFFSALTFLPAVCIDEEKLAFVKREVTEKTLIQFKQILSNRKLTLFALFSGLLVVGGAMVSPYFSVFMSSMGIDRQTVSIFMTANNIIPAVLLIGVNQVVYYIGVLKTRCAFQMIGGIGYGIIAILIVSNRLLAIVPWIIVVSYSFISSARGAQAEIMMTVGDSRLRVSISSLFYIISGIMQILAGVIVRSVLFETSSPYFWCFALAGSISLIGSTGIFLLFRKNLSLGARHEQNKNSFKFSTEGKEC